jgi:hypothetical protein
MSDTLDSNAKTIAEFRANQGRAGGNFEGAPMVLVHHRLPPPAEVADILTGIAT